MKKIVYLGLIFCFTITSFAQETRTENNGNLILEDVPAIPQSIKDDLKRYQNVRSAAFRGFHNENEGLYISTRFGNVSQLHYVQSPGAARNQVTYFQEPIGSVAMHPTDQSIIFTMDKAHKYICLILQMHLRSYYPMGNQEMEVHFGVLMVRR